MGDSILIGHFTNGAVQEISPRSHAMWKDMQIKIKSSLSERGNLDVSSQIYNHVISVTIEKIQISRRICYLNYEWQIGDMDERNKIIFYAKYRVSVIFPSMERLFLRFYRHRNWNLAKFYSFQSL